MFLLVFISFVLFFYALLYYIKFRRMYKFADMLPGPEGLPILGVATEFNSLNREEKCNKLLEYAEQFPSIGRCWFGPVMLKLYIHNPDYIQKIYNASQCLQKPTFYRFFGWGSGLVTADAKTWKVHRKLLNSAFTLKSLQSFIPIFHEGSKEFVRHIGHNLGKGEFNLLEYAVKATLDSICATSFGININAQQNNHQFNKYLQRTHEIVSIRMFNIQFYSDLIFRMSKLYKEDKYVRRMCVEFGDELIENRKQVCEKKLDINTNVIEEEDDDKDEFLKKPKIFVDHLLKVTDEGGRQFTESEVRDHVFTTISAGNETTALCVSYALVFLAIHQEVQEKAVNELLEVFGTGPIEIDYDRLKKCDYLEMIIKETLRLCPSVPVIARETLADIELEPGLVVPAGVDIIVNLFALHRRFEDWGNDSKMFNPDRFLPDAIAKRHPYSYMPFSIGVRNCIGQKYAMLSLKVMLINLLLAYKYKTHLKWEDIKWKFDIHLHITSPHWVEIEKRNIYVD